MLFCMGSMGSKRKSLWTLWRRKVWWKNSFRLLPSITTKCYRRYHIVFQQNCTHQGKGNCKRRKLHPYMWGHWVRTTIFFVKQTDQAIHVICIAPCAGLSRKRKVHLNRIEGAQGGCYESVKTSKAASFSRFHGFSKVSGVIRAPKKFNPLQASGRKQLIF